MAVNRSPTRSRESRRIGYIAAVVFNLIMLFVFHNLENWNFPFITEDFERVLPALDLAIGVAVVANLLYLVYDPAWFQALMQLVQGAAGFWAVLTLYRIFPFNFGGDFINTVLRFALVLVLAGIVIGVIIDLIRLLSGRSES